MNDKKASVRVFRFDPKRDKVSRCEIYQLPEVREMTVLDVLTYIYKNIDHSLSFRRGCERGRCGGCLVSVNGKNVFACNTKAENEMTIEPVRGFEVIKDIVVDLDSNKKEGLSEPIQIHMKDEAVNYDEDQYK